MLNIKKYALIVSCVACPGLYAGPEGAVVKPVQVSVQAKEPLNPFELPALSQDKIAAHQQKIVKTLQFHKYIRIGAQVGGTAACLYIIYRSLKSFFSKPDKVVGKVVEGAAIQMTPQEGALLREALEKASPGWFTFQWWKNNALYIVNSLACAKALSSGTQLVSRYQHEDNIEWFVRDNTKIKELADELRIYQNQTFAPVAGHEITAQDLYFHRVTLAGMARELVAQTEALVGFMEYRLAYFKAQGVILLPDEFLQPTRVVASMNAYLTLVRVMLPVPATDTVEQAKKLCACILQCVTDLQQMVNRFQGIEYSIQWRIINGGL